MTLDWTHTISALLLIALVVSYIERYRTGQRTKKQLAEKDADIGATQVAMAIALSHPVEPLKIIIVAATLDEGRSWQDDHRGLGRFLTIATVPDDMRGFSCHLVYWVPGWDHALPEEVRHQFLLAAEICERPTPPGGRS